MNGYLDWTYIRSFLSVVETGSFSAASRALGQSQPTIGRHIAELENHFKTPLFVRSNKGHVLTPKARDIMPMAEAMRAAMDGIHLAATSENEISGTVRLTASVFMSHFILPPIIADLRRNHPNIAIELIPTDKTDNLMRREADIALRMYRPTQLETITRKLGDVPIAAIASRTYLERKGQPNSPDEFKHFDLIGFDRNDQITAEMNENGIPATRDWFGVRCDNGALYAQMIQAGCGIGFCPKVLCDRDATLVNLFPEIPIGSLEMWIAAHESVHKSPTVQIVWTQLSDAIRPLLS